MRAINVVGYRGSGKTELVARLARALRVRGRKVGLVKHCHARIRLPERDRRFGRAGVDFGLLSDRETLLFSRGARRLDAFLNELRCDLVIVEGFKSCATMPRIVLARSAREARSLARGLAVAVLPAPASLRPAEVPRLARIVERRAFLLAGLDCGDCGKNNCRALAAAIVAGRATPGQCRHLDPEAALSVDGNPVVLNRFAARMVRNVVKGLAHSLKGVPAGDRLRIDVRRR